MILFCSFRRHHSFIVIKNAYNYWLAVFYGVISGITVLSIKLSILPQFHCLIHDLLLAFILNLDTLEIVASNTPSLMLYLRSLNDVLR